MRMWLGPWVWDTVTRPGPSYRPPVGATVGLDLRPLATQAQTTTGTGRGLFLTPDAVALGGSYREVPATLGAAAQSQLSNDLGQPVTAASRPAFVQACLTSLSVADGSSFILPLMPSHDGILRVTFGDLSLVVKIDTSHPHWPKVSAVLQNAYRLYRTESQGGTRDPLFYRRMLSVWQSQYNIADLRQFIPADLPLEQPLPHATTISDNFNGPDNAAVGQQLTWTDIVGGQYSNHNNTAELAPASTSNLDSPLRAESDLSTVNHSSQCATVTASQSYPGVTCRFAAGANTHYGFYCSLSAFTGRNLFKCVTGTRTDLTSDTGTSAGTPTLKVQANGSNIKAIISGVTLHDITDTAISTGTRAGMWGYRTDLQFALDDFTASDIVTQKYFRLHG